MKIAVFGAGYVGLVQSADLRFVLEVARTIAMHMEEYRCVVDKSTVPVGTADRVTQQIAAVLAERQVAPGFEQIRRQLATPVIFDGRNLCDPASMRKLGFQYFGIGRSA